MTDPATRYHFISGLPRAGTTLLAALLRQNPRFHADIISPVVGLVHANLGVMSSEGESGGQFSPQQRTAIIRGLFHSYYQQHAQSHPVIFDNNRGWTARLPLIHQQFPDAKVICCVRDIAWVLDSLERQYRKDPYENTRLFQSDNERNTVFSRTTALTLPNRLVGFAWSALKEAYYGEHSDKLLLIEYEALAHIPEQVMAVIYDFLGEEPWQHHFTDIDFDRPHFDQKLGLPGLHKVRSEVRFEPRRNLLPPELLERYGNQNFWDDPGGSAARVVRMRKPL